MVHFYVAILFTSDTPPVRAWISNGVLFAVVVVAGAYFVGYWTRRWAAVLAIVGVTWVAGLTVFSAIVFDRLSR